MSNDYYNDKVEEITKQYLSLSFDEVHSDWADHLTSIVRKPNATILDVGAGVGRDVKYIAEMAARKSGDNSSCRIYAVEPAIEMMKVGQSTTGNENVHWIQDSLSALDKPGGHWIHAYAFVTLHPCNFCS